MSGKQHTNGDATSTDPEHALQAASAIVDSASEDKPERHTDLAIMEVEEIKQKRRLDRLIESQHRVETVDDLAYESFAKGEIGKLGLQIALARAVQEFVRESYILHKEYDEEIGEDETNRYWRGKTLGALDLGENGGKEFQGLNDYLGADVYYTAKKTRTRKPRNKPARTEVQTQTVGIPRQVSWKAYLLNREFLREQAGLKLSVDDGSDRSGFDIDHIVKQTPE